MVTGSLPASPFNLLAIDPGQTWMGWAHLSIEWGSGVRCRYGGSGSVLAERVPFKRLIAQTHALVVAVESPRGYVFEPSRGPALLDTAHRAGGMVWTAEGMDLLTVVATAQQVRKVLCGKQNADDDAVRDAVCRNVFGCPVLFDSHAADAVAMGIVGARMVLGQVVLPDVADGSKKRKGRK